MVCVGMISDFAKHMRQYGICKIQRRVPYFAAVPKTKQATGIS